VQQIKDHTPASQPPDDGVKPLIAAIQQGDAAAFASFYDRYSAMVFGLIMRVVNDSALAEDVLQKCFLTMYKALAGYNPDQQRITTWITRIVTPIVIASIPEPAGIAIPDKIDMTLVNNGISSILFKGLTLPEAARQLQVTPEVLIYQLKKALLREKGGPENEK
jgi:hypothetical protein